MKRSIYAGHRFPPEIIEHAVWLYLRFCLSFRDVEDILARRGVDVTYETVRRWILKFGPIFARRLRRRRPAPTGRWHLDEMFVSINGNRFYLWRAVDDEGEVLDILVQRRRNKGAALRLIRKLLRKTGVRPDSVTTDKLRSYASALRDLGLGARHVTGGRSNNRAENSHQPARRKERWYEGLQVTVIRPNHSCRPCRHLQRVQRPTSLDFEENAARLSHRSTRQMATSGSCLTPETNAISSPTALT